MSSPVAYLTLDEFRALTVLPDSYVQALETQYPGFIANQLLHESAHLDSRLAQRYATPFQAPYPLVAQMWLSRIVTLSCLLKRGYSPTDEQAQQYAAQAEQALAELKEAADSKDGLYNIPLRADTTETGITRKGPLSYSEQSPYAGMASRARTARDEDGRGGGTYR